MRYTAIKNNNRSRLIKRVFIFEKGIPSINKDSSSDVTSESDSDKDPVFTFLYIQQYITYSIYFNIIFHGSVSPTARASVYNILDKRPTPSAILGRPRRPFFTQRTCVTAVSSGTRWRTTIVFRHNYIYYYYYYCYYYYTFWTRSHYGPLLL